MAVAAYASLLSLSHVLDHIQHPSMHRLPLNARQIATLHENVHFLQEFLQLHYSQGDSGHLTEDLARRIVEVAYEAELVIDSHAVNKLHGGSESESTTADIGLSPSSFSQDIDQVIEKIDSIKEELLLTMVKAEGKAVQQQQPPGAGSSALPSSSRNTVVGFDEHLVQIMDQLTGQQSNLQIIPIVGMGGIGKTTLARLAFENKYVVEHFDVRVWFTISQECSVHKILLRILRDIRGVPDDLKSETLAELGQRVHKRGDPDDLKSETLAELGQRAHKRGDPDDLKSETLAELGQRVHKRGDPDDLKSETLAELGERVHKSLSGKRYLIVMDDLWSTKAWDDLRLYFPKWSGGSRIIVTTRLLDVAVSLGSRKPYLIKFLNEKESWDLFCQNAFAHKNCSLELEEPGKKIAKSCRGLPLAIVVIGGFLAKSNMTREYWEIVAESVNSYANSENDEQCLRILALSYQHLPILLKPCFLYMRVYPEDHEIQVSKLIKLWIAEGFVKPLRDKNLEEVAEEYLKDLVDRNLILIRKRGHRGKIKTCGIHDLLRDLCMREFSKEPFFRFPKVQYIDLETMERNTCFLCSHTYTVENIHLHEVVLGSRSSSLVSSWLCNACRIMYPQLIMLRFVNRMLEIDIMPIEEFPQPTTLRYLTVNCDRHLNFSFVSPIQLLWNLQTLIFDGCFVQPIVLPSEIWEMLQLRQIKIRPAVLPYPAQIAKNHYTILENLHTLSEILDFRFTAEILERIPNMKKLRITYFNDSKADWSYYSLDNLAYLSKLESLYLTAKIFSLTIIGALPYSLTKLVLNGCKMPWQDMTIIGSLPNLQVLKLNDDAFEGPEWNPVEGEFLRLKFLSISWIDLVFWRAETVHFPCLESLELQKVDYLEEIPSSIGDLPTLTSIHLCGCRETLINSAKQILEEQQDMGNEDIQLYVTDDVYWRRRYESGRSDS